MSSSSSLVITVSFVLLALTGSVGALAMLTSQPPDSETAVEASDQKGSPNLVAEAPGGKTPASDALPAPAAPNPPAPASAESTPGKSQPQASVKANAHPAQAAEPGPDPEKVVPGQAVPPVLPKAFKVQCEQDRLTVRRGGTATFDCTLDGWIAVPTNVPIWFTSNTSHGGPCDGTQAFSSSPEVVSRSALQAPTSFTVTVEARGGGFAGGPVRVGTPWDSSEDLVEIAVDAAPGDQHPACNPGNQSL